MKEITKEDIKMVRMKRLIDIIEKKENNVMKKFKVTWEEQHSKIIEADSYEEAQDKACELDSDATSYVCCLDQYIEEIK